jgi:trigger factor
MKKKFICLAALLILSSVMLTSCITDMFGEAGITMAPGAQTKPIPGGTQAPEETDKNNDAPVFGSKPSYAGVKLSDYISVDYKGITFEIDALPPEITDKSIDANISGLIDYYVTNYKFECSRSLVKEGVVAEWDFVEIGFVGKIDGVAFDGGTSTTNVGMIVNEHDSGYIPGFAEGIIGAQLGTTVEVPVTFPDNYHATNLAGKNAIFEITVHGKIVYDITDDVINKLTSGKYKTLSEFKEYYKEYLTDLYDSEIMNAFSQKALELLAEKTAVLSYPNDQLLYYYNSNVNYAYIKAQQLGMSYEDYVSQTGETEEVLREKAKKEVLNDMIVYYVLEAEGKTYTDDEYNKALDDLIERYKQQYGYALDRKTIESAYEMNYYPGYLRYQFNLERVYGIAYEHANIVVKEK